MVFFGGGGLPCFFGGHAAKPCWSLCKGKGVGGGSLFEMFSLRTVSARTLLGLMHTFLLGRVVRVGPLFPVMDVCYLRFPNCAAYCCVELSGMPSGFHPCLVILQIQGMSACDVSCSLRCERLQAKSATF